MNDNYENLLYNVNEPIVCEACLKEYKNLDNPDIALRDYVKVDVGFTRIGIQIWCQRHEKNIKNNLTLKDSSSDIELNKYLEKNYLHIGGPVLTDRVVFLHTNNNISKSVPVSDEVSISGNIELLSSIQKSKDVKSKLFLGHAGWDSGQLEREIENGFFLIFISHFLKIKFFIYRKIFRIIFFLNRKFCNYISLVISNCSSGISS